MKKLVTICAVVALMLAVSSMAQATPIQGGGLWNVFGVSGDYPTFTLSNMFAKTGTGDFAAVPSPTWLTSTPLNVTNPVGWTFGSDDFGTWMTTGGTYTSGANFVTANLQGTFTPGTMFGSLTQNLGTMTVAFNTVGGITNANGTFNMIPEPATMALLGLGGLLLRKRK